MKVYTKSQGTMQKQETVSEEFVTKEGLRQSGVQRPALFNIAMDNV